MGDTEPSPPQRCSPPCTCLSHLLLNLGEPGSWERGTSEAGSRVWAGKSHGKCPTGDIKFGTVLMPNPDTPTWHGAHLRLLILWDGKGLGRCRSEVEESQI